MENEKDFMGKVADVATDVADTIVKTTSDLYQKGKVQVEIAKLKSDIRESYKSLGAASYAAEKGDAEQASRYAEIVAAIDELKARLADKEGAVAAEKEAKAAARAKAAGESAKGPIEVRFSDEKCDSCGETRIGTLPYCAYCGAKFEIEE